MYIVTPQIIKKKKAAPPSDQICPHYMRKVNSLAWPLIFTSRPVESLIVNSKVTRASAIIKPRELVIIPLPGGWGVEEKRSAGCSGITPDDVNCTVKSWGCYMVFHFFVPLVARAKLIRVDLQLQIWRLWTGQGITGEMVNCLLLDFPGIFFLINELSLHFNGVLFSTRLRRICI